MLETGFINLYKEKGYTSHDVVAVVRRTLSRIKTGHTGTLDPQAEGVLPICIGRATKFADYIAAETKAYTAEVVLGVTTDTGDISGTVISRQPVYVQPDEITRVVSAFEGDYLQTPPMYSAIKINGKKLYELARKGVTVERTPRPVRIEQIQITAMDSLQGVFTMDVTCSKGTYIRSLCEDIGLKLGCGACMGQLIRTRSGLFTLQDAVRLDELKTAAAEGDLTRHIRPLETVLPYSRAFLLPEGVKPAVNGNPVPLTLVTFPRETNPQESYWLYHDGAAVGLFCKKGGFLTPEVMLT